MKEIESCQGSQGLMGEEERTVQGTLCASLDPVLA